MSGFESAITDKTVFGDHRVNYGTFHASGCTGGPIFHGLKTCLYLQGTVIKNGTTITSGSVVTISGVSTTPSSWNYIGTLSGSTVTTVSGTMVQVNTLTNASGIWMAYGR